MGWGHASAGISQLWAGLVGRSGRESPIRHKNFAGLNMDDPWPFFLVHPSTVEWHET